MRQRRTIRSLHKVELACRRRAFGHILRSLRCCARNIIHDLDDQHRVGGIPVVIRQRHRQIFKQAVVAVRRRVLLTIQQRIFIRDRASGGIVTRHLELVAHGRRDRGTRQRPILDHLHTTNRQRLHAVRRTDREGARAFLSRAVRVRTERQRTFHHRHVTTVGLARQVGDGRLVIRRYRRTTTITTTERRQNQQRQPPQRHRRHARAQRLPSLHPVRQHAHRIRPHRALRCVRIHIAVLVRAHQQVVTAFAVANLAVVLVVVLDHQIGLLHITTLERDVQVLAHALGRDVLRAVPRRLVREVVLHVAQRLDAHALATGSNAPFAPGNLHGLHRLAGVVDLQDDVLQAHDASLFPRQRLVFMGALRESCGGGSSYRATARSMTVR